nr:unnamed protein product [Digitaria exilis]
MASMPDGEGLFVDPEPFSPSIFLDLPSTPRPDGSGQEPASSDDLVLPFISRMLMEDFNDEFFYQFPDHPTLLQAQEPYAQILYDSTTTTAGSSSSGTNSSASGSAAALSPSSSDDPSQPYPNAGLHDSTAGDVGAFFLPAQDGTILGFEQSPAQLGNVGDVNAFVAGQHGGSTSTQSSASLEDGKASRPEQAAAEGEHGASSVFFSGQNNRVNMDMLNQAFLKGMEEAKKLLPTNNNLLMNSAFATTGEEEEQARGNGRVRKNRVNWDDLEAETCRKSKLMVPEPEENDEMVDEMIVNGYDMCLKEMKALQITMGSEAKKNTRKGRGKSAQGRRSTDEAVDLSTMLIHCAQAVARDNRRSAFELLKQIKQHSSPKGDATQRLAHYFAEGLEARLAGSGSELYRSLVAERIPVIEYLKAYQLYLAACCFKMMAFKFSNMTMGKVMAGMKKVHIVDYGIQYGFQWPTCEGLDRVERPETYKQWQVRNRRAGLRQLPLDPDVVKSVKEKVREQYHKDFVIDVDHQWLLEGWKGRILYAMSTWAADDAT